MAPAAAMVADDPSGLHTSEGVLHTSASATVTAPGTVPDDVVVAEERDAKTGDSTVAAKGEDTPMVPAERFDRGAAVVNGIVSIPRTAGRSSDDAAVSPADENLGVARPAVALRLRSTQRRGTTAGPMANRPVP
jgi:hypothetical protein